MGGKLWELDIFNKINLTTTQSRYIIDSTQELLCFSLKKDCV